jgi:hypothetical protein
MYVDENHATHIETPTVKFLETECNICARPIQYHPKTATPGLRKTCEHDFGAM